MVVAILHPPAFHSLPTIIHCASKGKRSRKQYWQQKQKQISQAKNTSFSSYPKSSPTPLLTSPKPTAQTKFQALDSVIKDLETSIQNGITVDTEIFASLLETCYQLKAIDHGIKIHRLIPTNLLRKNKGITSKLVRLYALCGLIDEAHQLFDQMSTRTTFAFPWNSLISGYAELGQYEDSIALYFQMEEEGVEPDQFTFPRLLKACAGLGLIRVGQKVHRDAVRFGFGYDGFVLNALVDMYAKCGDIVKARRIFDKITCKDLISWNSMLTGYIRHGLLVEALHVFRGMIQNGFEPDSVAISAILANVSSCPLRIGAGAQIHGWVLRHGVEWNLSIANSLIVVYSNGEKLDQACWLFDHMPEKDVVSWNSIISAHCKDPKVLMYFEQMERDGILPDHITFVSLLSACAHLGLVKDGERLFSVMREKYGINPRVEHYACMTNLYGRAGLIDEAYRMIVEKMEFEASPAVWGALLYGCYVHGNVDIGQIASQKLFELEPDNEHNFELLMGIYRNAGRLEDAERVERMLADRGLEL
ncbi:Pentatricopeptide repeat-containing protein [Melia azedarach]|uniref:Pentatricopeptide repeat-containing protein n=1 Tax=Melia azedarach TaxID=155640 RepID=A0ACC1X5H1_MELAZ|nr:Pentatricopeptide repeat-containing protein [Melia azedarach]